MCALIGDKDGMNSCATRKQPRRREGLPPKPGVSFGEWMQCDVTIKVEAALAAAAAENSSARRMKQGSETTMLLELESAFFKVRVFRPRRQHNATVELDYTPPLLQPT